MLQDRRQRFEFLKCLLTALQQGQLVLLLFVALGGLLQRLFQSRHAGHHRFEVGEDEVIVQRSQIARCVNSVTMFGDLVALEIPHHRHQRIAQPNVWQVFAILLFAVIVAAADAGEVAHINGRIGDLLGFVDFGEVIDALVRHDDRRGVFLKGRGGIDCFPGQRSEQRALSGLRRTNEANDHVRAPRAIIARHPTPPTRQTEALRVSRTAANGPIRADAARSGSRAVDRSRRLPALKRAASLNTESGQIRR